MISFPQTQHGVILADPPLEFKMRSGKGYDKSPEAHYNCMSMDEMKAMRDDIIFASNCPCVCIMWATWCRLDQAIDLMTAWGFKYKTGGDWIKTTRHGKQTFGTGYIFRNTTEPFIIGTIGEPKIRNKSTRDSFFTGSTPKDLNDIAGINITAKRREHSRKPPEIYKIIESLFEGPYLELFARTQRHGWESWGNETTKFKEAC